MADRQPASLTADTRLRVPLTVVSRKMRGELIVLRTGTEEYFNFQGSGPVLWELVERYHTVAAVVDRAAAVYRASVAAIGPGRFSLDRAFGWLDRVDTLSAP